MSHGIGYRRPDHDGYIWFDADVVKSLQSFRQIQFPDKEACGLLLGQRRGNHLHITKITEPQVADRRSRVAYWRAAKGHRRVAVASWKKSKKLIGYLGEWHTHPQPFPAPSTVDLDEWRKLARLQSEPMLFLIVGITDWWLGLHQPNGNVQLCLSITGRNIKFSE